jgi:hypothetical protein
MTEQEKKDLTLGPPLARILRLVQLPGWLGKRIQVPAGWVGVAVHPNGESRIYQPGNHALLSWWQRQTGKGIGIKVGLVSTGPFTQSFNLPYLLSGDGVLLDASLVCSLVVNDPVRFFTAVVVPQGEPILTQVDLDPGPVQEALGALVQRYAAADLVSGLVTSKLGGQLGSGLAATLLQNQGIGLNEMLLLTITRSEDRAIIAEKVQSLKERLQNVDLDAKMAEVENQAQLDDFIHQVEPDLADVTHLQVGSDEKDKAKGSPKEKLADAVRSWLAAKSSPDGGKRWRLFGDLFRHKAKGETPAGKNKLPGVAPNWWQSSLFWILFVIAVGLVLTVLINHFGRSLDWPNRVGLMVLVWGFVLEEILKSIKRFNERREKLSEDAWMLPGIQHLGDLVRNDRQWADDLLRGECVRELEHVREVVADVRSREYKRGKMDLALRLKNEVERNASDCIARIQRQDFGHPPYLTDLHISQRMLAYALDKDEDLLLLANALSDRVHLLQQESLADQLTDKNVAEMDANIIKFGNQFFERGHPMRMPDEETQKS